jgi:hypothetical protein
MGRGERLQIRRPAVWRLEHPRPCQSVQEVHQRRRRRPGGARSRDPGGQHAVDDRQIGAHILERVPGVDRELRTGRYRHHLVRLRLEGDVRVRVWGAAVLGHSETKLRCRATGLPRRQNRNLVPASGEQ